MPYDRARRTKHCGEIFAVPSTGVAERLRHIESQSAVTAARLMIALNSTLASEAFGAALKVLFVNSFGERWLQPTKNTGIRCLSEPTYEVFAERVDDLLTMNREEYIALAGREMKETMSYDFDRPAYQVIRERVLQLVGSSR